MASTGTPRDDEKPREDEKVTVKMPAVVAALARFLPGYGWIMPKNSKNSEKGAMQLRAADHRILRELGRDGRLSNVELARRVRMSESACLRRVRALEESG